MNPTEIYDIYEELLEKMLNSTQEENKKEKLNK